MSKELLDRIVDRFLSCPLPEGTKADPCVCNPHHPHRTGTNLLTAAEAKQMLGSVLNGELRIEFNLATAQALVATFGGDDETEMTVAHSVDGHSGPGLYAYSSDYPDEGSIFLGTGK